jgi:hypothetical protein
MYETPKLKRLGQAEEVVLGVSDVGDDLDGCYIPPPFQFAAEEEFDED